VVVQKADWLKDVTPAEAEEMRRSNWDIEDVDLDPIPLRYVQPALKLNQGEHDRVLADAAEASRLAYAYNKDAKVAPFLFSVSSASTPCTSLHTAALHIGTLPHTVSSLFSCLDAVVSEHRIPFTAGITGTCCLFPCSRILLHT
jgi:hypothetical protein